MAGGYLNKQVVSDNWNELFNIVAKKEHIEAFKLRYLNNYSYDKIAETTGYANASSARRAVMKAYERIIESQIDDIEKARIEAIARHKDLLFELYNELELEHIEIETKDGLKDQYVKKKTAKNKLATINTILKVEQQLANLQGIIKVDQYNQTNIQINNNTINTHEEALKLLE